MKLLLAPHFDDETLFAAYICLRERPLVLFCFDGAPRHGTFQTRWAEGMKATRILGCEALALREQPETIADRLSVFDPEHAWAPLPERDGNSDHNLIGEVAQRLWPGRVSLYATYTSAGRTTIGESVSAEPGWPTVKREALACYESQISNPSIRAHFDRDLDEYELVPEGAPA